MTAQVTPRLRDKRECPCGCGAYGVLVKRTGHARACRDDCTVCARRTSSSGSRPRQLPERIRRQVAARADGRCQARPLVDVPGCADVGEHAHHVRRRSQGGTDALGNLRWVCHVHHDWIHHNIAEAVELGLLERTTADG